MFMLIVLTHILKATLTRRYLLESMLVLYLRGVKKEIQFKNYVKELCIKNEAICLYYNSQNVIYLLKDLIYFQRKNHLCFIEFVFKVHHFAREST